ncbi:MAG: ATP synthase F1 subunit epsilon [Alphaproteobacteria bacterium]
MADTVTFELVSPERLLVSEPVEMVVVPGTEGLFGVLPGHALMISGVEPGLVEIYESGQVTRRIFVGPGFAEVTTERCTVLADMAIPFEELERGEIEGRIKGLTDDMTDARDEAEKDKAAAALVVAEAMLKALDYHAG